MNSLDYGHYEWYHEPSNVFFIPEPGCQLESFPEGVYHLLNLLDLLERPPVYNSNREKFSNYLIKNFKNIAWSTFTHKTHSMPPPNHDFHRWKVKTIS